MFSPDQYELLDFGSGRKLECFGDFVLDRPAPAADDFRQHEPPLWDTADARYDRTNGQRGRWTHRVALPEAWTTRYQHTEFTIKLTPFGHVGLFAEQQRNWQWIDEQCRQFSTPCRILNLFAYTGGSTLAAATAGAEVVHIDSAQNVVHWARRNAENSGLATAPIRWIAEDAVKFVEREIRRGNHYQGVILDPPSYGHGPKGEPWKISEHLPHLLNACRQVLAEDDHFLLLTSHSPQHAGTSLQPLLATTFPDSTPQSLRTHRLQITDRAGRHLPSGTGISYRHRRQTSGSAAH